jgi:hypothetical protein
MRAKATSAAAAVMHSLQSCLTQMLAMCSGWPSSIDLASAPANHAPIITPSRIHLCVCLLSVYVQRRSHGLSPA